MEQLAGKIAVVTGGASGIGLALAKRFAAEGMKLVVADIERPVLEQAGEELAAAGAEVVTVPTDVSLESDVNALAAITLERFGDVHLVCNNAGVGSRGLTIAELPLNDFAWVTAVNLFGVIHGINAFLPHLRANGVGHIVNTASISGLYYLPRMGPYNASKAAVVALSETLRFELDAERSGVGVSVLCPSWVRTNITTSDRNRPERFSYTIESEQMAHAAEYKATASGAAGHDRHRSGRRRRPGVRRRARRSVLRPHAPRERRPASPNVRRASSTARIPWYRDEPVGSRRIVRQRPAWPGNATMTRLGVVFSQADSGTDAAAIRAWAVRAEEAGFEHMMVYDHVLGASAERLGPGPFGVFPTAPYTNEHTFHEILTLISHLAAVTTRIAFVTSVLILPQRQTALAAKQIATIDLLSGGRLRVAVGAGWNAAEYGGLGADFDSRRPAGGAGRCTSPPVDRAARDVSRSLSRSRPGRHQSASRAADSDLPRHGRRGSGTSPCRPRR